MKKMITMVWMLSLSISLSAQNISISALETAVTENFDGMGSSGTTFPTGWSSIRFSGSGSIGAALTLTVTNGATSTGGVYNVGTTSASDRSIGVLSSGSTVPAFGASFQNNTGVTIGSIDISGVYEQWKSGSSSAVNEVVVFEYSFDATALNNGNWNTLSTMNFNEILTSTVSAAAVDGNATTAILSGNLTGLNFADGSILWIRWRDTDDSGSDGMHAIDDFSLTAYAQPPVNDGDGTATLSNSDNVSPTFNTNIFLTGNSTVEIIVSGVSTGDLNEISVDVPTVWGTISNSNISISGSGFSSASSDVNNNIITITGANLSDVNTGTITIEGLTAPSSTGIGDNGIYTFVVKTAKSGGTLTSIATNPIAYIALPIENVRDQDANGVPLDLGSTIALRGTVSVKNGLLSTSDLSIYVQNNGYGIEVYMAGGASIPAIVGNEYAFKGVISQISGKTRITVSDFSEIGLGSLPSIYDNVVDIISSVESKDGLLVTIKNATISGAAWPTSATAYVNLTINDGTGSMTLRVNTTTSGQLNKIGGTYDLVGVLSQFDTSSPYDSGYQLFTRDSTDFYTANSLPVELTSFTISASGKGVNLAWSTATESNNLGWDVERSMNGASWTKIGFVAGKGTTSEAQHYSFTDSKISGKAEYRLKQTDTDGKTEYSRILAFEVLPSAFSVSNNYPNPFNPTTNFRFDLPKSSHVKIVVSNILGQQVAVVADREFSAGTNIEVPFNAGTLASGLYYYTITVENKSVTKTMMLMK